MDFAVAVDGSEQSERTLDYAFELGEAMSHAPSITAVHVVDPDVYTEGGIEPVADLADAERRLIIENIADAEDRGQGILDDAVAFAADRDVELRTELLYGDPVEQLSDVASAEGFDALFVGHRGHSEHAERFLGSVAKGLVERSDVPVTVVR
ncbi:universal stress protein [Halorientalis brevis]|uniref:Universal stress protein n=1 Tax=Halorientalis brevis TaxID=1126241 RepID=A0ABD6CJM6_9EURY|nr:universal stress protein [Halorientalis brevis]